MSVSAGDSITLDCLPQNYGAGMLRMAAHNADSRARGMVQSDGSHELSSARHYP